MKDNVMRKEFLPFHVPEIGDEEISSVSETLRSGWLTTGPRVKEFEEEFSKSIGARHSICVSSGTAALHLALEAVGVREGDEVIVPTMTFAATAEAVLYFKAKPVLVDSMSDTLNVDPNLIEKAITDKTKGIIPVHLGGHPCDMEAILEVARRHNLKIIEDAAHALPARYKSQSIGTIGDVTCFSFYVTKTITTGEGGMITTENDQYASRMRVMSLHGISHDAWKRYDAEGSWYYEIKCPGYKYNMSDVAAAIGIEQFKKCDRFWDARREIAESYDEGLSDLSEIVTPTTLSHVQHAWHLYVIQLRVDQLGITRNEFIELLKQENIGSSVHFIPLHLHPYYRDTYGYSPRDFPKASRLYERIVSLPIYPRMTGQDVQDVIRAVKKLVRRYSR